MKCQGAPDEEYKKATKRLKAVDKYKKAHAQEKFGEWKAWQAYKQKRSKAAKKGWKTRRETILRRKAKAERYKENPDFLDWKETQAKILGWPTKRPATPAKSSRKKGVGDSKGERGKTRSKKSRP